MICQTKFDDIMMIGPSRPQRPTWNPLDFVTKKSYAVPVAEVALLVRKMQRSATGLLAELGVSSNPVTRDVIVKGMEIGDDRGDTSNSPKALAVGIIAQSLLFKMKTSWKDTSISKRVWNLCEVTSYVPTSKQGSISHAKKSGFGQLQFTDCPPLRIVIDAQKGDRGHSSSAVGKAQMLGSRTRSANSTCRPIMELANWLQDGFLNTSQSPDPKYLPWLMGGSSAPSLWGVPMNTYLYVKAYKNGSYCRVYGSATSELRDCVGALDRGTPAQPVLCSNLRLKQDYLHITFGSNVAVPLLPMDTIAGVEIKPIYKALGGTSLLQGVENRLVQAGVLLTKTAARASVEIANKAHSALFGYAEGPVLREEEKLSSLASRAKFNGALQMNSAVSNLLNREGSVQDVIDLCGDGFLLSGSAKTGFSYYDAQWLHLGGQGEAFTMSDLLFSEDMYLKEEVSVDRLLKVSGIPLTPQFTDLPVVEKKTVSRAGLWQVSETMLDWAHKTVEQIKELRTEGYELGYQDIQPIYTRNRQWVADDALLIGAAREAARKILLGRASNIAGGVTAGTILLVSRDKRLARVMSRTTGLAVALLHPLQAWNNAGRGAWSAETIISPQQALGTDTIHRMIDGAPPVFMDVLMDTGSIESTLQKLEYEDDDMTLENVYVKKTLQTGIIAGKRVETCEYKKVLTPQSTPVEVYFGNGTVSRCCINMSIEQTTAPRSGFFRVPSALRRFQRNR